MAQQHYNTTNVTLGDNETAPGSGATIGSARTNDAYAFYQSPSMSVLSDTGFKKQKLPKAKSGRSSSRPLTIPQRQGSGMSETDVDKKRNKLGYQRISVACSHCRRRKIRCVLDETDPQERCQNCIRLKKECLYYPVDHQNAVEEGSQSSSKAGRSSTVSASSSPAESGSGRSFVEEHIHGQIPIVPSNARGYYNEEQTRPVTAIRTQDQVYPAEFYQPSQNQYRPPWANHGVFNPRIPTIQSPTMSFPNQHYWQSNQPGAPGDFAPFPLEAMQHAADQQSSQRISYATQRGEPVWHHPSGFYGEPAREVAIGNDPFAGAYHEPPMDHTLSPTAMQYGPVDGDRADSRYLPDQQDQQPLAHHSYSYHSSLADDPSHTTAEYVGNSPEGSYYQRKR